MTDPKPITEPQMRRLHALLRDHGITGDASVHDYLSVALGREVESRRSLTERDAARLIDRLDAEPVAGAAADVLRALRAPFPPEAVGKLPKSTCRDCSKSERKRCDRHQWVTRCQVCGNSHSSAMMHVDYVGHADVTDRLLSADPTWTWRPFTADEVAALPPMFREGLWIHLTVGGVTRPGFGDADNKRGGNAVKEAIGDALRNASMRFGVALDLWAKGDREWMHAEKHGDPGQEAGSLDEPPPARPAAETPPLPTTTDESALALTDAMLVELTALAESQGHDLAWITKRFRARFGDVPVEALTSCQPEPLAELVDQWQAHLGRQTA